jgi:hypothetical protein
MPALAANALLSRKASALPSDQDAGAILRRTVPVMTSPTRALYSEDLPRLDLADALHQDLLRERDGVAAESGELEPSRTVADLELRSRSCASSSVIW